MNRNLLLINVQKFHKPLLYKSKNKIPWRYFINMICIYEPLCEGKGHELVNAGIIELLNIIRPYEKLIFMVKNFIWKIMNIYYLKKELILKIEKLYCLCRMIFVPVLII